MIARNSDAREVVVPKMRVRRRDFRKGGLFVAGVFAAVFLFVFLAGRYKLSSETEAANLDKFDPGYIISDYAMGNYTSMSEAEIQAFLSSKVSCNRSEGYYNYLTTAYPGYTWHLKDGHIVCLPEELFGSGETIGTGETAAHIIWQAAQDYKINPQVLIVLLQKEQGLITDDYPNTRQYRSAMGYGCPDTAPCAEEYYGFRNQVRKAAELFRMVLDGGWTNYPLGENYIQYNPSWDCGGSMVNIRSLATSALYRYTPYQPNAAALAAGYGTGDGCSAYGNRNFYHYFEDWFSGITDTKEAVVEVKTNFERTVNDGWYQLYSEAYNNKVVDISGGVRSGMSIGSVILFDRNTGTTPNQVFYIKYNSDTGYYNIINPVSMLYFDVYGGNTENSTPLIVFGRNASCNQDWLIEKNSDDTVTFMSRCSGKVLDVTADGRIIIFTRHGGDNQRWNIRAVQESGKTIENGVYQISNSDTAFDIFGGIVKNMTSGQVVAFYRKDQDNQKFEIIYQADKKNYKIKNPASDLYLTNNDGIRVSEEEGDCSQEWIIEPDGEYYKIYNVCSRGAVSISDKKIGGLNMIDVVDGDGDSFDFERVSSGNGIDEEKEYQLKIEDNRTIDIYGGVISDMNIANLVAFPARSNNNDNQIFRFKRAEGDDNYYIYNPKTQLYLDVEASGVNNNTAVIGFKNNGGHCNQIWKIIKNGDGYKIISTCSNKLLTVSNVLFGGSPKIVIYDDNWKLEQKWKIVEF